MAAPCSVEASRANNYYRTEEEYLFAIADALKEEYRAIVAAGLLLQVDDAWLPAQYARMLPQASMADYRRYVHLTIEALNHALEGIPEDRVRYHICWGSQNVPHIWDVPLADIIDLVLRVKAQAYAIEAANPRHEHEWEVWQHTTLPDGKILIPGVISHATNVVEHPRLVAQRLQNFARCVGRENVIAGTDCGFSQNWNLARVHPEVQWAKLEALVEGARLAYNSSGRGRTTCGMQRAVCGMEHSAIIVSLHLAAVVSAAHHALEDRLMRAWVISIPSMACVSRSLMPSWRAVNPSMAAVAAR